MTIKPTNMPRQLESTQRRHMGAHALGGHLAVWILLQGLVIPGQDREYGNRTSDAESCSVTKVSSMALLFDRSSSSSASMLLSLA